MFVMWYVVGMLQIPNIKLFLRIILIRTYCLEIKSEKRQLVNGVVSHFLNHIVTVYDLR